MAPPRLTDAVFAQLELNSFAVVDNFLPPDTLVEVAAAIRSLHPRGGPRSLAFPYPADCLNAAIVDEECVAFAKRWCGTDDVRYRSGGTLVRYGDGAAQPPAAAAPPAEPTAEKDSHVDNFSLLPPTEDRRHKQLFFWFLLNDCDEAGNPTRFFPSRVRGDEPVSATEDIDEASGGPIRPHAGLVRTADEYLFTAPAGSLAIFTSHTLHGRNQFLRPDGERFVLTHRWGRADHPHEGQARFTMSGANPEFQRLISSLSPRDREYFGFPRLGHRYYTKVTLAALERQYGSWDRGNEYAAALHPAVPPPSSLLSNFPDHQETSDQETSGTKLGASEAQQVSKNDELGITNEELCITNEELCIKNEECMLHFK